MSKPHYYSFYKGVQRSSYSKYYTVIFYKNENGDFGVEHIVGYFTDETLAGYHYSLECAKIGKIAGQYNPTKLTQNGLIEYQKQLELQQQFKEDTEEEFRMAQKEALETGEYIAKF